MRRLPRRLNPSSQAQTRPPIVSRLPPEHKLLKSEEDLPPLTRQRSNTLPKSFGSQLEKKPAQEKVPKPPVESTLEGVLKKLQEKRDEVSRPEDIKVRHRLGAVDCGIHSNCN